MDLTAVWEASLPDDARIERKKMFEKPGAFVNRQMFFGIFEETLVARIGPARVLALKNQPGMKVFEPTENRPWDDYVQVDQTVDGAVLKSLATEALAWTLRLPERATLPRDVKKARKKARRA